MIVPLGFCFPLARRLNTLALADDYARQVGVQVEKTHTGHHSRRIPANRCRSLSGRIISFVGLIVPIWQD